QPSRVPVRAQPVAPQGVDCDQQHVGAAELARTKRRPACAPAAAERAREEQRDDQARYGRAQDRDHRSGGDGARRRLCSLARTSRSIFIASAGATPCGPSTRYRSSSSYVNPISLSSVCPSHRPAVGVRSTIACGTPRSRASARTWLFTRFASGRMSTPPSPYFVKYPIESSDLLPVPATR